MRMLNVTSTATGGFSRIFNVGRVYGNRATRKSNEFKHLQYYYLSILYIYKINKEYSK